MGNWGSKLEEINEFEHAQQELEKSQDSKHRLSFRERLRTRILRADPRSVTDGMDRTPIAVNKQGGTAVTLDVDTPENKVRTLGADPRSPGEIDRTPIQVEESVRRRVLAGDECETPVRGAAPPIQVETEFRSPLIIETGPDIQMEALSPINPVTSTPEINLLPRNSGSYETPKTVDLSVLAGKTDQPGQLRPGDRGQPSRILQDRLRSAVHSQLIPTTPQAAGDLNESELSVHSSNDSSLVI